MKILIGICGLGNGHLSRQTNIINLLLKNNVKIVIATTKNQISYFQTKYENIDVIEINIPWITCNDNGINFSDTKKRYIDSNVDQFAQFITFCENIEQSFCGKPDLVITDYEPNVAQYSYAANIPLICMEQQSKFLYLDEIKIDNYSIKEEKIRINYFFPKFDHKVISSFFPINIEDSKVKVVTPIISKIDKKQNKKNHILVYLSPYGNKFDYIELLNQLKQIDDKQIIIYTKETFEENFPKNITVKNFSDSFKEDLTDAYCLICTAGHQLISESISLEIPMYVIPLNTYEQNYNAKMVEKYELGEIGNTKNSKEIISFINNVPKYVKNIIKYRQVHYKKKWEQEFLDIINLYKKY